MHRPQMDARQIRTTSESELFVDLVTQFPEDKDVISSYQLKHVVSAGNGTAYAIYEENRNILAVQFYLNDRLLSFVDDDPVHYMSIDEIRLLREVGEVAIDGIYYSIESTVFNIVDGSVGCQHMIIFNLRPNY